MQLVVVCRIGRLLLMDRIVDRPVPHGGNLSRRRGHREGRAPGVAVGGDGGRVGGGGGGGGDVVRVVVGDGELVGVVGTVVDVGRAVVLVSGDDRAVAQQVPLEAGREQVVAAQMDAGGGAAERKIGGSKIAKKKKKW